MKSWCIKLGSDFPLTYWKESIFLKSGSIYEVFTCLEAINVYAWVYTDIAIILHIFCDYTESLVFSLERKAGNVVHTLNTMMDQSISKTVSSITTHSLRYCSNRIIYIVSCFQGDFLYRVIVTKDFQIKKRLGYILNNDTDLQYVSPTMPFHREK